MHAPAAIGAVIDAVMDRDRDYFERHPDEQSYQRDYVPGEFWPYAYPQSLQVIVHNVGVGLRLREPVVVGDAA